MKVRVNNFQLFNNFREKPHLGEQGKLLSFFQLSSRSFHSNSQMFVKRRLNFFSQTTHKTVILPSTTSKHRFHSSRTLNENTKTQQKEDEDEDEEEYDEEASEEDMEDMEREKEKLLKQIQKIEQTYKSKIEGLVKEILVLNKKPHPSLLKYFEEQKKTEKIRKHLNEKQHNDSNFKIPEKFQIFKTEEEITHLSYLLTFQIIPGYDNPVRSFDSALEIIGDKIIKAAAHRYIYSNYNNMTMGCHSVIPLISNLVSNNYIASSALQMQLNRYLRVFLRGGKDMTEPEKLEDKQRNYMLASAIEMILGYISHHKSMDLAVEAATQWLFPVHISADHHKVEGMQFTERLVGSVVDGQDHLRELCDMLGIHNVECKQLRLPPSANLKVLRVAPLFRFGIYANGKFIEEGLGKSKKFAMKAAIRNALVAHYTWPIADQTPFLLALSRTVPIPEENELIIPNNAPFDFQLRKPT